MTPEQILIYIINLFLNYLDELKSLPKNDFICGEMTAYVETLEILQSWKKSELYGLDFSIADKYII